MATHFEIGSHTYSHLPLPSLSPAKIKEEIFRGKNTLEQDLGHEVSCFCYPLGKFNKTAVQAVKECGIRAARTTQAFQIFGISNRFMWGTTLQAYPHTLSVHFRHGLKEQNWSGLYNYLFHVPIFSDWRVLAIKLFDLALLYGGIWHLWGHSWEIEEFGIWDDLEYVFQKISGRSNVSYLTNGEIIDYFFPE